ncbi:MAG: hypothetical protein QF442_01580, partial [Candidatus Peribacteraceae bacterium]|nr:hypothetical protein [Candidatus Peribacteraceae bacterium]
MKTATATGKIILSGEYAVVFGYPGIAMPAPLKVMATFEEDSSLNDIEVQRDTEGGAQWAEYIQDIINPCIALGSIAPGTLTLANELPLSKGMGSSTAFVVAITKCLLGEKRRAEARLIEDSLNPGHSGIDFDVIWDETPILYRKENESESINLPANILKGAHLIDTGEPDQQTPELVAWVSERKDEVSDALKQISDCTERLQSGEDLMGVIRDHNEAQVMLGVVPEEVQELNKFFVQQGGAAKVIGAGSRTGGGGMVLALGIDAEQVPSEYSVIT